MKYLLNSIGISMIKDSVTLEFNKIGKEQFCKEIQNSTNAIGHESTVQLVNTLCNTSLKANRIMITLNPGDIAYIIGINTRLEEGKILTVNELNALYKENKIVFYMVTCNKHQFLTQDL